MQTLWYILSKRYKNLLKEEGDTKSGPLHIHNDGARVHDNAHATSRATEIMPHSTTLQTRKEIYSSQGSIVELFTQLMMSQNIY